MPQIRCPNCGTTINLENRKKIDQTLIMNAVKKKPRTFTELLHITKLSRKTLSLRLKELCVNSLLIKDAEMYRLNGSSKSENNGQNFVKDFSEILQNRRIRIGLTLIMLLMGFSVSGYVLATFFAAPPEENIIKKPIIIGNFTMSLEVNNVDDLYGWQVAIFYNSSQLEILEIIPGNFVGTNFPLFTNSTDSLKDLLLLAGCKIGNVAGESGSGRLATLVFGYFTEEYNDPIIVPKKSSERVFFETLLLNSEGQPIPINENTLALVRVQP